MSFDPKTCKVYGSERVERLITEIEQDFCACCESYGWFDGVPKEHAEQCRVHLLCEQLREAVREAQPIY
jgi:hypothetical protein